jgi:hypothetical protein
LVEIGSVVSEEKKFFSWWPPLLKIENSSNDQNCSVLSQKVPKFELNKHNDELFNIYYGILYELWTFAYYDRLCKLEKRGMKWKKFLLLWNYRANLNQLCWNDFCVVPFQNCVRQRHPVSQMSAFIKILFLLSKWFQTRRFLREFPIGSYVKLISAVAAILVCVLKCRTQFWKRTIGGWNLKKIFSSETRANLNQTFLKWSLGGPLSKMCPSAPSCIQGG